MKYNSVYLFLNYLKVFDDGVESLTGADRVNTKLVAENLETLI